MAKYPHQWAHGWIPLTANAALSKARGNHKRAEKLFEQAAAVREARRKARGNPTFVTPHPKHQQQLTEARAAQQRRAREERAKPGARPGVQSSRARRY